MNTLSGANIKASLYHHNFRKQKLLTFNRMIKRQKFCLSLNLHNRPLNNDLGLFLQSVS